MTARRDNQQEYMRTPTGTQPPALTHHHSMSNPIGGTMAQAPPSIAPHPSSARPGIDRAHTFPTPPTSASSMTMGMGTSGGSYEYGGQAAQMHPASTPPGSSAQHMQYPTTQSYDTSRQMYSAPQYGHYSAPSQGYGQVQPGVKTEMAPPARAGAESDHPDSKAHEAYANQQDADGEHEGEYTHTSASYGARRASYSYKPNAASGPVHPDQSHLSPEMTHSPHQNGSGRATPRTTNTYASYSTPQRAAQLPSSNLYNVMSGDARGGAPNGPESYQQHHYQPHPVQAYPTPNGIASNKRMRDEDDQDQYGRPPSASGGVKRQRADGGPVGGRPMSQPQTVKAVR